MRSRSTAGERLAATFLLGVVLFNPPILKIFTVERFVFGVPVLFIYMFGAWMALLALLALGNRGRREDRHGTDAAAGEAPDTSN
jgi:hypothetical protein